MSSQTFLDYASNNNGSKKGGTLLSSVSIANNILSAINNENSANPNDTEIDRSIRLAIFDTIGIIGDFLGNSKLGKSLNVGSWATETVLPTGFFRLIYPTMMPIEILALQNTQT